MYALEIILDQSKFTAMFLSAGAIAGFLSGLLGVGGGIVIVPVVLLSMSIIGVDPSIKMYIALGTSMATIVPTSMRSIYYHNKAKNIDWALCKSFAPGLFFGAIIGGIIATNYVKAEILSIVFAIIILIISADILILHIRRQDILKNTMNYSWLYKNSALIFSLPLGFMSSVMGIGGGTLSVPVLNRSNYPIHKAIGTSAAFGFIIAVPAVVCYIYGGQNTYGRPYGSIGYVNIYLWIALSVASILTVPLGAKVNKVVTPGCLRILFVLFLSMTSACIFIDLL